MVWTHVRWMGTLHLGILSSTVLDGKLLTFKSLSSTWTRFFFFTFIKIILLENISKFKFLRYTLKINNSKCRKLFLTVRVSR